jgi:5'-nucleotidase
LLLLCSCVGTAPAPDAALVPVQLIAFNDFHGNLEVPGTATSLPAEHEGEAPRLVPTGGVAWFAGQVRALRQDNPRSVVVAAGDLIGGSPLTSSLLKHEPTITALSELGLQVSAVGNHEFDRGVDELLRVAGPAKFTYLAANLRYRDTGAPVFPAWKRIRLPLPHRGNLDIAFIGAVLRSTPDLVNGNAVAKLEFLDEADSVNRAVREIQAAGINTIVLLIHEGGFTTSTRFDDTTCPGFRGPILDIVDRLDPAIKVVISGHTHRTYICHRNGRLVTSAGAEGRFLTDINMLVNPRTGDVTDLQARQMAVINDSRPNPVAAQYPLVPADAVISRQAQGWERSVATTGQRPLGRVSGELTRRQNEAGETTLGDVIADAQLWATHAAEQGGAQMAFVNNGGLRADLAAPDGTVTYAKAFAVHPFGNFVVTLTLTGAQIDRLLETQWLGAGSLLQVSDGLQFRWNPQAPPGERIAAGDILLHGQPLVPEQSYRVAVSDFLAGGGDGYTILKEGRDRRIGLSDLELLQQYLAARTPLAVPARGRITRLQ